MGYTSADCHKAFEVSHQHRSPSYISLNKPGQPADCTNLKRYYSRWTNGCAWSVDILAPCTTFSKYTQIDEVDILGATNALLESLRKTEKLASKLLYQWLTYTPILAKCTSDYKDTVYQCQKLKRHPEALSYYSHKFKDYYSSVNEHINSKPVLV